jgi:hypothetical protein
MKNFINKFLHDLHVSYKYSTVVQCCSINTKILDKHFNGRNKTFIKCDESLNHIYVNYDVDTQNSFFMDFCLIF